MVIGRWGHYVSRMIPIRLRALQPVIASLLVGLLAACSPDTRREAEQLPEPGSPEGEQPADLVLQCELLPGMLLATNPTRADLRGRFGEPDSVRVVIEANRHVPDAIDSIFTLHYPGLVVSMRTPPGAGDMAEHVAVTDNRYLRFTEVGIGVEAARITDVLGPPTEADGDRLVYSCGMGAEQPTTFVLADGRVSRIFVEYYVD